MGERAHHTRASEEGGGVMGARGGLLGAGEGEQRPCGLEKTRAAAPSAQHQRAAPTQSTPPG